MICKEEKQQQPPAKRNGVFSERELIALTESIWSPINMIRKKTNEEGEGKNTKEDVVWSGQATVVLLNSQVNIWG